MELIAYENNVQLIEKAKEVATIAFILKDKYKYIAYFFYMIGFYDLETDQFMLYDILWVFF
jgi:hypothetical protein